MTMVMSSIPSSCLDLRYTEPYSNPDHYPTRTRPKVKMCSLSQPGSGWSLITCSVFPLSSHSSTASTSRSLMMESRSRDMKASTWGSRVGKNRQIMGNMLTALARR